MRYLFYILICVMLFITQDIKAQKKKNTYYNGIELCFKDNTISNEDIKLEIQNLTNVLDSLKQKYNFNKDVDYTIVYYYTEKTKSNEMDEKCLWMNLAFNISKYLYEQYEIKAKFILSNEKVFNIKVNEEHVCLSPMWK